MAHRRHHGALTAAALRRGAVVAILAGGAAAVGGCGSTQERDGDTLPAPPREDVPGPGAPGARRTDAPPRTAAPGPTGAPPAATGTPRWLPAVGSVVRLAGIAAREMKPLIETRTVRAGGGADLHEVDVEVAAAGDAEEDVARETYIVTVTRDDVRVALAPDPLRRIPGPAREVPREPVVGASWDTPAGRCRVEAVRQDVVTFLGTRAGCTRIRVTSPTGRITFRWFDPELGEVRREILDRDERVLAAWALCGAEAPSLARCRELLLRP